MSEKDHKNLKWLSWYFKLNDELKVINKALKLLHIVVELKRRNPEGLLYFKTNKTNIPIEINEIQ